MSSAPRLLSARALALRAGVSAHALALALLALALLALALERSLQLALAHLTAAPVAPAASHWPTALRRRLLRIELDASLLGRRRWRCRWRCRWRRRWRYRTGVHRRLADRTSYPACKPPGHQHWSVPAS